MAAYYNEFDKKTAEWLRQLIKLGTIAPGDVDERDIRDVTPIELKPYDQCHFFAGIGVWSHVLRTAGWPDDKPVWTGSCPCQPFSTAGKRKGADDDRDLWWAFFWLISQCRPETVFGEQVASKDGLAWWDVVQTDLERAHYAATAFDLCAAGLTTNTTIPVEIVDEFTGETFTVELPDIPGNAPQIRQRLFWVANANTSRRQREEQTQPKRRICEAVSVGKGSNRRTLADSTSKRINRILGDDSQEKHESCAKTWRGIKSDCDCRASFVGNSASDRSQRRSAPDSSGTDGQQFGGRPIGSGGSFWDDAIWLPCRDGKARTAKSGTFPLVDGIAPDLVRSGDSGLSEAEAIQTESTSEARVMRLK
ncbi:MAG: DNA cytosine methyltransferase, partial [Cyanobacteria bacterium P01_F01_bin.3]